VEVSGPYACFTRPELKAERLSYEVITPSAARGVLEAIFWKPEFRFVITRIEVLREIQWMSVRRNEVDRVATLAWVRQAAADHSVRFDAVECRDQRSTVCLRDVGYRIYAQMELAPHADANIAKYRDQFRRRVEKGGCHSQPFLGTREFSAAFGPVTSEPPYPETKDLGVMLHSIVYAGGQESYQWFHAVLDHGIMDVPAAGAELPSAHPSPGRWQGSSC
jgi:CRISPR-associated protein Cas5d